MTNDQLLLDPLVLRQSVGAWRCHPTHSQPGIVTPARPDWRPLAKSQRPAQRIGQFRVDADAEAVVDGRDQILRTDGAIDRKSGAAVGAAVNDAWPDASAGQDHR